MLPNGGFGFYLLNRNPARGFIIRAVFSGMTKPGK